MKTIGIIHYQVGGTDGVSLEIDKWTQTLQAMGHTVHLCAGDLGVADGTLIEELYHHRPDARRLNLNTFHHWGDYASEAEYRAKLYGLAEVIERRLDEFVRKKKIDCLIPQNVWSVAMNPAAAIAVARLARRLKLPTLAQHHDFYWERTGGVSLTCGAAIELADCYLPPRAPFFRHVVINSLAQHQLARRKGLDAPVVPNVFDFDAPPWQADAFNRDFRARLGLNDSDVLILQATRLVPRKGIELAIEFVAALNHPERRAKIQARGLYNGQLFTPQSRIVLVLAGYARDDLSGGYRHQLAQKIARMGIEARFIENIVAGERRRVGGQKIYSLWDTYVFADFVTYPSLWEGWGNQFLEALRAKLPVMVFEYPVFRADIKP
ncbi:MAG: glycosyltransferase, partial [Anaerolineae bacterium]